MMATNTVMLTRMHWFTASKEIHFAQHLVRHLLKSYSVVSEKNLNLSGKALYREVLLHSGRVDSSRVDLFLQQAENNSDLWTTGILKELGFRQVVHFLIISLYLSDGHLGTIVSFKKIIYSLIPSDL